MPAIDVGSNLVLVVPYSMRPGIYRWSVELLASCVRAKSPEDPVDILDLRDDAALVAVVDEARRLGRDRLFALMRETYRPLREPYLPAAELELHLAAVLLMSGAELQRTAQRQWPGRRLRPTASELEVLARLQRDFDARFEQALEPYARRESLLFGVSAQHYQLLPSLHVARSIRRVAPSAPLILGGDPMDQQVGRELVEKLPWLDGVVEGPGEIALCRILERRRAGEAIRDMVVPRLINHRHLAAGGGLEQWLPALRVENEYAFNDRETGVRWDERARAIRVLSRRGCRWSRCTFCSRYHVAGQSTVHTYGDTSPALLYSACAELIEQRRSAATGSIDILFDDDDTDLAVWTGFLRWLASQKQWRDQRFRVLGTTPARQLATLEAHELAFLREVPNIAVSSRVPIESLSPATLRHMRKGSQPLQNIKALKVAHDAGFSWIWAYYFAFYPLEDRLTVGEELRFLRSALHLMAGPRARVDLDLYFASTRDGVGRAAEDFGVRLHQDDCPWMHALLGLELPATYNCDYSLRRDGTLDSRLTRSWLESLRSARELLRTLHARGPRRRFRDNALRLAESGATFALTQLRLGDFAFTARAALLAQLVAWSGRDRRSWHDYPRFELTGNLLTRSYPRLFGRSWSLRLGDAEREILTHLYHPRTRAAVLDHFASRYDRGLVEHVLDTHLRLGSLLADRHLVMAVFNDPAALASCARDGRNVPCTPAAAGGGPWMSPSRSAGSTVRTASSTSTSTAIPTSSS